MEAQNSKRKCQDISEDMPESKKTMNDTGFSGYQITADSTHIQDEENDRVIVVEEIITETVENSSKECSNEEDDSESLADELVTALNNMDESSNPLEIISDLKKRLEQKEEEMRNLLSKNCELGVRVALLEKENKVLTLEKENSTSTMRRYQTAIIKLNKLAKLREPEKKIPKEKTPKETTPSNVNPDQGKEKKKTNKKCRYENRGQCKDNKNCNFFHPRGTCQQFSSKGSCQYEDKCLHRHPIGVCRK